MIKRWILYLVALSGCLVFFAAYQGWTAWILLVTVALMPLLSLVLSLPLVYFAKAGFRLPEAVTAGEELTLDIAMHSPLPLPPSGGRYQVTHSITGENRTLESGKDLPTDHCGHLVCKSRGLGFYDLLGLFRLGRNLPPQVVLIRPRPLAAELPQALERHLAHAWKPKYGGGFSENHELRLYRPGDSLNQVHWKLSAKTGKLIIREAMIPACSSIRLSAELTGTPEEVDRKLGRLLSLGAHLLELQITFDICVLTGNGLQSWTVSNETALRDAIDGILCCAPAPQGAAFHWENTAAWQLHVGGDADEV